MGEVARDRVVEPCDRLDGAGGRRGVGQEAACRLPMFDKMIEEFIPVREMTIKAATRYAQAIGEPVDLQPDNASVDEHTPACFDPVSDGVSGRSSGHLRFWSCLVDDFVRSILALILVKYKDAGAVSRPWRCNRDDLETDLFIIESLLSR
jgi:hypothetical protein